MSCIPSSLVLTPHTTGFPAELIQLTIRLTSDLATLAAWYQVEKGLIKMAGPLLFEVVSLTKPAHVVPFLHRYVRATSSSTLPPSSSLLFPLYNHVRHLEILSLPPQVDTFHLFGQIRKSSLFRRSLVLRISWDGFTKKACFEQFWVPSLLVLLQPREFRETGTRLPFTMSGVVLEVYVRHAFLYRNANDLRALSDLYSNCSSASRCQQTIDAAVEIMEPVDRTYGTSDRLESLEADFIKKKRFVWKGRLVSEIRSYVERWTSAEVARRVRLQVGDFVDLRKSYSLMREEWQRLKAASLPVAPPRLPLPSSKQATLRRALNPSPHDVPVRHQPTTTSYAGITWRPLKSRSRSLDGIAASIVASSTSSRQGGWKEKEAGGGAGSKGGKVREVGPRLGAIAGGKRSELGRKVLEERN